MMKNLFCLLLLFINNGLVESNLNTITWKPDNIVISSTTTFDINNQQRLEWDYDLYIKSNRKINHESNTGHFHFNVLIDNGHSDRLYGKTECISIDSQVTTIRSTINSLNLYYLDRNNSNYINDLVTDPFYKLNSFFDLSIHRFYDFHTYHTNISVKLTSFSYNVSIVNIFLSYDNCAPYRTVGNWMDSVNWDKGVIPTVNDNVIFGNNTGVVEIFTTVQVNSLTILGGLIINYQTNCPPDWSTDTRGSRG